VPLNQDSDVPSGKPQTGAAFMTTHWTTVLNAGDSQCPEADEALSRLCRNYWYPLYVYVRRRGHGPDEAQDLTQEFFARLLASNYLRTVDRRKGRFRWFLMSAMENFLAKEWRDSRRLKRGGGQPVLSLDEQDAEGRYIVEPAEPMTAETMFERRWALTVLERTMQRLRGEFVAAGKTALFEALQVFLTGEGSEQTQEQVGQSLNMSKSAVNVTMHRMRKRYGELLRQEIAETVSCPEAIDEELRHLQQILSGG